MRKFGGLIQFITIYTSAHMIQSLICKSNSCFLHGLLLNIALHFTPRRDNAIWNTLETVRQLIVVFGVLLRPSSAGKPSFEVNMLYVHFMFFLWHLLLIDCCVLPSPSTTRHRRRCRVLFCSGCLIATAAPRRFCQCWCTYQPSMMI